MATYSLQTLWSSVDCESSQEQPTASVEKMPHQANSVTSLSVKSFCSSCDCNDDSRQEDDDSLAALSTTLTPTNPFLPYILHSSTSSSTSRRSSLFSFEDCHHQPDKEKDRDKVTDADTDTAKEATDTDTNCNILNAYYNPFFTWSKSIVTFDFWVVSCVALRLFGLILFCFVSIRERNN